MKYTFQTDSAAEGLRIDACIRRFLPELPSRAAQEAFSHRDVKLDGKRVKPDVHVHAGQAAMQWRKSVVAHGLEVSADHHNPASNRLVQLLRRKSLALERTHGHHLVVRAQG